VPAIVLVRHGQASYGAADYDVLSERGHEQAALTHAAMARRGITADRVVCGTLRRQRETAQPWVDAGSELVTDGRWDEYRSEDVLEAHGDDRLSVQAGEGRQVPSQRDFQAAIDAGLLAWIEAGASSTARETHPAFKARVLGALDDACVGLGSGTTVVIHTSAGIVGACCAAAATMPDSAMIAFNRISINASLTKIIRGSSGLTLISFNEHHHLEAADLVTYR
jgi:broad specificity phosphatase PhoE